MFDLQERFGEWKHVDYMAVKCAEQLPAVNEDDIYLGLEYPLISADLIIQRFNTQPRRTRTFATLYLQNVASRFLA